MSRPFFFPEPLFLFYRYTGIEACIHRKISADSLGHTEYARVFRLALTGGRIHTPGHGLGSCR